MAGPEGRTASFKYRDEFMAFPGVQQPRAEIADAEIVFVGYGIVAPEYQWDDFKDVDVKGKVLLIMNNDPEDDPKLFAGKTRLWYGRWDYKYEQAAKKGAAGAIIIHTTPSAGYGWNVIQTSWAGELYELPDEGGPARPDEDVGDGRGVQEDRRARRQESRQPAGCWRRSANSGPCRSVCVCRSPPTTRSRKPRAETSSASCPEAIPGSHRRSSSTPRTTTTSESRRGRSRGPTPSTTARGTTRRALRPCWRSRARTPRCPSLPGGPSCSPRSRPRSRVSWVPSTWPSIRRCRPATSPRTSTSTRSTSGERPRTSR